jgi:hypothetical protein
MGGCECNEIWKEELAMRSGRKTGLQVLGTGYRTEGKEAVREESLIWG